MEETEADIKSFNFLPGNSSKNNNEDRKADIPGKPTVKFNPNDLYYDMSGDKHLVIFNHHTYKASRHFNNAPPAVRKGTNEDVKGLKHVFGKLGFKIVIHNDKEYQDLWKILVKMREEDYSTASCLCVVIMTHGSKDGQLYAADRPYDLNDVLRLFESNPTLANKPKLFFVQACRGMQSDAGVRVVIDGEVNKIFVTPSHADFLVMRSTVEEYRSYRDIRGSWMIQELCKAIQEFHEDLDLLHIITLVHKRVAYYYATNTPDNSDTHDKKQVPETRFTLTKILKFS